MKKEKERGRRSSRESNREDGEFANADDIRKLASGKYEDHGTADDEVNDVGDWVREE